MDLFFSFHRCDFVSLFAFLYPMLTACREIQQCSLSVFIVPSHDKLFSITYIKYYVFNAKEVW